MAQLENSSSGVFKLRTSLNESIKSLKKTAALSEKLVTDIQQTWRDHQYKTFKNDFNDGIKVVSMLFNKMEEFDTKLSDLQMKLKHYEEMKQKGAFRQS